MPLFNIDDRNIKRLIKNFVGAKEGDFNGQRMMCGTTVNPIVNVADVTVRCSNTGALTNSNSTLLTPTVGKKLRIYSIVVTVSKEAACAGAEFFTLACGGLYLGIITLSAAALVATDNYGYYKLDYSPYGILCQENASVGITFNGALTAGAVSVNIIYSEEE